MTSPQSVAAAPPAPSILVIFGITGDLAKRKLLPALYHLLKDGLLDESTVILGITRRDISKDALLGDVELCVNEIDQVCDPEGIRKVREALVIHQMSLVDGDEYDDLRAVLDGIEASKGICMNRLYYLSIPPQMFSPIVRNLGKHGLNDSCAHGTAQSRLLVEKPFGYDLKSAESLIQETGEWFQESQIFRIDHYLAKETVQNILAFRMYNPMFSGIWNNRHIASIEITAFEKIDIEGRATFYEEVGALRDFIQSHLLQLLAIVVMDLPGSLDSDDVHRTKLELLQSISPVTKHEAAASSTRGQYAGYTLEAKADNSATETFAAVTLSVPTEAWRGVPMTLRTGKAMSEKRTDVRVRFIGTAGQTDMYNDLVFRIQPSEGISLNLHAKTPGYLHALQKVVMDFDYQYSFDSHGHPDAYERVLVDAARGDHTLFTTSKEVLAAWKVVDGVLQAWQENAEGLLRYSKGSADVKPTIGTL